MTGQFRTEDATAFREAISQWQLAARTEVKRSSSLPSSMFDACDPMLEARLAESVEAMMYCLHKPEALALSLANKIAGEQVEMRVETVTPEELARLPLHIRGDDQELDLEGGVAAEYLSLLVDACTTGDEATQAASRALLQQDFAVAATSDLQNATQAMVQCLQDLSGVDQDEADEATQARLAELCGAIAASVIVASHDENHRDPDLL
jgi:hypothetical protein